MYRVENWAEYDRALVQRGDGALGRGRGREDAQGEREQGGGAPHRGQLNAAVRCQAEGLASAPSCD